MTAILAVEADHQEWRDRPDSRVAALQVELRQMHRVELHLGEDERLGWAKHVTIELDEVHNIIMLSVMGMTFSVMKVPEHAKILLERCVFCGLTTIKRRGESTYRHVTERAGIHPPKCHPEDPDSTVATPRKLAGMVLVNVPTEETSHVVPLAEVHAGQYVVMPTTIPDHV